MTKPAARTRASLALAVLLHIAAALLLPDVRERLAAISSAIPVLVELSAPAPQPPPSPPVIPVRLPAGSGFELQTELGAIARRSPSDNRPMPGALPGAAGGLSMSGRLGAAAQEAAAAASAAIAPAPPQEQTRVVAELSLASGLSLIPQADAYDGPPPPPATGAAPKNKPSAAEKPKAATGRFGAPAASSKTPAPVQRLDPALEAESPPRAATSADDTRPYEPPALFDPARPYAGLGPERIAEAPPLPPLPPRANTEGPGNAAPPVTALTLGAQAAPDRGPGEFTSSRSVFFSRLTAHLLKVNQLVLAEAVRATPRLTVDVRFTVDRSGRVLSAEPVRGTGSAALDEAAVRVIQRASPLPRMADDMPQPQLELSFPVQIYR